MTLAAQTFGPLSGLPPKHIVVLFHGLGSNGADLISLAPLWAPHMPNTLFISPDAPFPCDMAPTGYQWFSLREWTAPAMLKGLSDVQPIVDAYLDSLLATHGLPNSALSLVGFSQGTMLALYVGPRRAQPCAGILGYSGALLGAPEQPDAAYHAIPTCLVHGAFDDVVPVTAYHEAMAKLRAIHTPVEGITIPRLGHSIDDTGLSKGLDFLRVTSPRNER